MGIKKDFFAPLASGLGATRRAAVLLLVMMLTMAQAAWATDVVTYTISRIAEGGRYIYYLNGSDGSSQVLIDGKYAAPQNITLEMGSDVTFNVTTPSGTSLLSCNSNTAEDINKFGFSCYFSTANYLFTFTSKSRYITHIQIDGRGFVSYQKAKTTLEVDNSSKTCTVNWEGGSGGNRLGAPGKFIVTYETNITYNINYVLNGGTNASGNPTTYVVDEGVASLAAPTRTGYTFGGWYNNSSFSGSAITSIPTTATGDMTLYAKWTANTYNVAYNPNGGSGTMSSQAFTYDVAQNLRTNMFTNTGKLFDGWNTAANGSGTRYAASQSVSNLTATNGATVTLYAQWKTDPAHISVNKDGTEYTIHTAEGWGVFCDLLGNNDKGYFTGKTVKLGSNITVSRMAGVRYHDFTGTFDGNKKTLTFNYGSESSPATEEYTAPFRYVEDGCTIKNLHVDGVIFTKAKYATGLIGSQYGAVSIENCRSSIVIHSTVINTSGNDGTHAGFVATNSGSKLTIEGCLFDGKILTTSTNTTSRCAGFVGWKNNDVTIKNCIYAPATIADGETEVITGTGSNLSATFSRNGGTFTNCFYTRTLGTVQGEASLSVTAGKDVTVSNIAPVGEVKNTYDVSGITAYNKGLSYGNKFYYGNGDDVNLTLSHSTTPEGYSFDGYTASSGTLVGTQNPYTLTMSDGNVTINASFSENVLTLDDASDNSKDIYYAANGGLVYKTVTLSGRTLYKDGAWNTLCLPFDVKLSESVLAGAKARKLTAASVKGSTFNLTFSDEVTELEAGVPYIIKWESGENITNPVFNNVTVDATDRSFNNGVSGDGRIRFIGTNNTVSFTDDDNALLMGAENTLYYVNAGACIRANRAYFRIGDDDVYCARRITSFNIDFSDETTGISGNCRVDDVDSSWFTLQGVKLADKPTQNGVYIHNGKKVVIK